MASNTDGSGLGDTPMVGGDSLDDIIRDNSNELHRRMSLPQQQRQQQQQVQRQRQQQQQQPLQAGFPTNLDTSAAETGLSMADFAVASASATNVLGDFSFGGDTGTGGPSYANSTMAGMLGLDAASMSLATGGSADFSPLSLQSAADLLNYTSADLDMAAALSAAEDHTAGLAGMYGGPHHHHHHHHHHHAFSQDALDPVSNNFNAMDMNRDDLADPLSAASSAGQGVGGGLSLGLKTTGDGDDMLGMGPHASPFGLSDAGLMRPPLQPGLTTSFSSSSQGLGAGPGTGFASQPSGGMALNAEGMRLGPPQGDDKRQIYSKSGFDMIRALWYVATRPNPKIMLGAVDMSCSFVVCDVTMNDCPIIYVSDNFQNLTGYNRHEIVGQNCRFLQSPSGKVEAGSNREYVDNYAVYSLKQKIDAGDEVQQSLINYRKGGQPFLNLLTMIPIPWDSVEVRYFIGFQIDLVDTPEKVTSTREGDGLMVNYTHSHVPQYVWHNPTPHQDYDSGQSLNIDEVSRLLEQFQHNGQLPEWHRQSWDKMLLENTDDMVHVLSLKGQFLYLSPSCRRILEFSAAELVQTNLGKICHPSDIVPLMREFKEVGNGKPANLVFRIQRKQSGYTWFESNGAMLQEQGKGRKYIVLVGRQRPVHALSRRVLEANGGIGDSELWTKLSTSGMFLFVSSNVKSLLDLQPESLVGTSIQDLMRKETRAEFGRVVEKARKGKIVSCKHEVHNRRGQVLMAQTILYPGDSSDGDKCSFLLGQTKVLKFSSKSQMPSTGEVPTSLLGFASAPNSTPILPGPSPGNAGAMPALGADTATASAAAQAAQQAALKGQGQVNNNSYADGTAGGGTIGAGGGVMAALMLQPDDNLFLELKTTRSSSWQFELRQMEKNNRILAEQLQGLLTNKKKRKRRKGVGNLIRDCANCHTRNTPEWRRGPSGNRDLCNSCGLRYAKQTGRISPRNSSRGGNGGAAGSNADAQSKMSSSPVHSPLQREMPSLSAPSATAGAAAPASSSSGAAPSAPAEEPEAAGAANKTPPLPTGASRPGTAGSEVATDASSSRPNMAGGADAPGDDATPRASGDDTEAQEEKGGGSGAVPTSALPLDPADEEAHRKQEPATPPNLSPPSQPMLEGGSGEAMASIREEGEGEGEGEGVQEGRGAGTEST